MVYISFILKILLYQHFHTFFLVISHLFSHLFQKNIHYIIRLLRRYKNIYDLHRFLLKNSFILAISHLFWRFHTFFHTFFKQKFSPFNPPTKLLQEYIYSLHRFSIENSSKLAISHLFWRFNTFFHTFFKKKFSSYNPPICLLQEYIWFTQVFY